MSAHSLKTCWQISTRLTIFLLVFLLWIQWPMREFLWGNARLFNDFGQIVFAFFWVLAFAVACTTQSHLQLTSSERIKPRNRLWTSIWSLALTLPWALFVCWRLHLPQSVAVLLFAGLISPMNGSVASTAGLLQRTLDGERLHNDSAATVSLASCAATVGLVIPPSLVLILMGDAMMRAHTEAFNSGLLQIQGLHVMNTQDMFHAALLPGLIVFALWSLVAAWTFRHADAETDAPSLDARSLAKAWLALLLIVLLLSGVFNGVLYAVEAAATGCLVLCMYAAWLLRHKLSDWVEIWRDTFAFSGSLLSLLMAATTFSLIFRLYETDVWISNWIVHAPADVRHMAVICAVCVLLFLYPHCVHLLGA